MEPGHLLFRMKRQQSKQSSYHPPPPHPEKFNFNFPIQNRTRVQYPRDLLLSIGTPHSPPSLQNASANTWPVKNVSSLQPASWNTGENTTTSQNTIPPTLLPTCAAIQSTSMAVGWRERMVLPGSSPVTSMINTLRMIGTMWSI